MGFFDALAKALGLKKRQAEVVVVGLDNSGKTTMLNHLRPPDDRNANIVPTVGFQHETIKMKGLNITAFDMAGSSKYRHLWSNYYQNCHGIIFVIDASDRLRLVVAHDELEGLLDDPNIKNRCIPLLFFANKSDLPDAASAQEISEEMQLTDIRNKPWYICATNAITGDGIQSGIDWLAQQMLKVAR